MSAGRARRLAISVVRVNMFRRRSIKAAQEARESTIGEIAAAAAHLGVARAVYHEAWKNLQRELQAYEENLATLRGEERSAILTLTGLLARRAAEDAEGCPSGLTAIVDESREAEQEHEALERKCDKLRLELRGAQSELQRVESESQGAEQTKRNLEKVWFWLTGERLPT